MELNGKRGWTGMQVLVVGANGQVGRLLMQQLLAAGDTTVAGLKPTEDGEEWADQGLMV